MFDSLRERVQAAWPQKGEWWPLVGSFGVALLAKAPISAINTTGGLIIADRMRDSPELVGLALTGYALFNLAAVGLDYAVLRRDRVGGSPKANTLYRALTLAFPKAHEFNAAAAEIGTMVMNLAGLSPDLSAMASTAASVATGDLIWVAPQRTSDMAVTLVTQIPYNLLLWRKGKNARPGQNS